MSYYKVLQVDPEAEPEVINRAYKALCLKYHPDIAKEISPAEATRQMQRINKAYSVVSSPEKRREYDRFLRTTDKTSPWDKFMEEGLVGLFLDKIKIEPYR